MREMVLNHASLSVTERANAIKWLQDVAVGISDLIQDEVVTPSLRASYALYEIHCMPDMTLQDAYYDLGQSRYHDEYLFLMRLVAKYPLLTDTQPDLANRFRGCEHATLSTKDGEPLVFCAIANCVAVGFPSSPGWDRDSITVTFNEMLPDSELEEASEMIDNLTRSFHARTICARHRSVVRDGLLQSVNGATLWDRRRQAFPNLLFGPDVESHLAELNPGILGTVINKLASLDESAVEWHQTRGAVPPWQSKVTDENFSVKTDPTLREARRFRSNDGTSKLFMWHARFGSSGRIHLSFDRSSYQIEVGYVGLHLPM